jgi:hypothetical protein
MTNDEEKAFNAINYEYGKDWIPIRWAVNIIHQARTEKKIVSDYYMTQVIKVAG